MTLIAVLRARLPFNFHSVVQSHGWYQLDPFEWHESTHELRRIEQLDGGRVLLLTMRGNRRQVEIEVLERLSVSEQSELAQKVAWMFSLDRDLKEFYALAESEPRLAHVPHAAHGRFLRSPTVWEDIVKVMMTTNIQWGGTKRLVHVLVEYFGAPLESHRRDSKSKAFPPPQRIARTRESTLRNLGIGYRSSYLLQIARLVADGKFDLESLRDLKRPTDEIFHSLRELPGIGPYAAATILTLLGRFEYLGVDSEALSLVSKGFYGGKPVTEKEVHATFAKWGKYKSLAYWFWDWDAQTQQASNGN